jgi:hypothetical protein
MAKVKNPKIRKDRRPQLPLDDMRWRPVAELVEKLLPHIGGKVLIAQDLTEALTNEKIRCMRRSIRMGHVDVDELCDVELERNFLGGSQLNEPSAAEHFSELLHRQLFEPFTRVRSSHGVVTPKLIIAAMGGDAGMILVNGITLGQYVERLAAEANSPRKPGHSELVPASFWATHGLACSPNGDIGVGFRFPPNDHGPSEPSSTLTANWVLYLWEPDCVTAWPRLAPQAVAASEVGASEPVGRKPGPRAKEEWQLFVAKEFCAQKYSGKSLPTAGQLAQSCQDELGYQPAETAINKLLRDLQRLLG